MHKWNIKCDIQTTDADITFDAFIDPKAQQIYQVVDNYRARLR